MKSFNEFLTESAKTYNFKIRVAGVLPEDFVDHMKSNLAKYEVIKLSAGKTTPIMEKPLDFPQLQNMEVTYFELAVEYPTTPQVLQAYIGNCCDIDQAYVIVRNANDPREEYQETKDDAPYEAMLTKEDMEEADPGAQVHVGGERIMSLLKELETVRKENEHSGAEGAPVGESSDIGDTENTKAVVGG